MGAVKYKVATLTYWGDEGIPCYTNIQDIEAVSEKQALFLYEKKNGISYYESHIKLDGRQAAIYKPENDYFMPITPEQEAHT